MRRIGAAVIAIVLLAAGTIPDDDNEQGVPNSSQDTIAAAIRAVQAQMQATAGKLDATGLFAYVLDSDTPPIVEDGVVSESRAVALERTQLGFQSLSSISYSYAHQTISVMSPNAALWVADGMARAKLADGREVAGPFAESIVFVQRDGQWKVLHAHRSTPNSR